MTDLEKIAYAKSFIDKLAAGIDPTDDSLIPEGDVAAKARIVGCFSYVSEVLGKLTNAPDTVANLYRVPERKLTAQVLASIECSQYPVSVSAFAQRVDQALRSTRKFTANEINSWLMHQGYLEKLIDYRDKSVKRPTQKGVEIGIFVHQSTTQTGRVTSSIRLNLFAQQFIRDHLQEILAFSQNPPKLADQLPHVNFTLTHAQLASCPVSEVPLSISQIASRISSLNLQDSSDGLKAGDLADWLVHLGLLHVVERGGKNYKLPTNAGSEIGIIIEERHGQNGLYPIALYTAGAQKFIIDNIHALIRVQ
ncbi:MAG: hypothetical protein IKB28_00765 [Clostridia bacterium]|nr:hypothetical protein [Clostridia bacterium]